MKRGNVVVIDLPFSDGSGSKKRPALVVQSDAFKNAFPDTIVASISTSARGGPTQVLIDTTSDPRSGLRVACGVRCEMLHVIDNTSILGAIGELSKRTMKQVDESLKKALGLS